MANRRESQRTFEQALALDPRSVDARIGLATVLVTIVASGWSSSIKEDEARAEQLLVDALGRDPNGSMAHYAMGLLRIAENRLAEAYTETEAAVAVDVTQIGRDLGVRYVIEGSVRRSDERVQVNVQLIDAETGAHVWADRFDTDRTSLTEAQREITGRLARSLNIELVSDVGRRIEQEKSTESRCT
jgi:hypothetical protein